MPKLTKRFIDSINEPGTYRDSDLTGFYLEVSSKSKTYKVKAKLKGTRQDIRITIGRHGDPWTSITAREEAERLLRDLRSGVNPNAVRKEQKEAAKNQKREEEKAARTKAITLGKAFEDFLDSRDLKKNTIKVYTYVVNSRFQDWLDLPLIDITRDMVESRHRSISQSHPGDANHAMRILRSVFNYAQIKYEDEKGKQIIDGNPVERLTQLKSWNKITRRQDVVKQVELQPWCKAVLSISNPVISDYLMFVLFTGLRKNEAATLKWSDVDFRDKSFTVQDTKNRIPHTLPITDYLDSLLMRRWADKENDFVFPAKNEQGHIVDIRFHTDAIKQDTGIDFTIHSLRRTFITIAKRLGIDEDFVKGLANHKTGDVTFGYTVMDDEDRRNTMQKITDYIVKEAQLRPAKKQKKVKSKVVSLSKAK